MFKAVAWALELDDLPPAEKLILVVLAEAANPDNEYGCWVKHSTIAQRASVSRSTVQRKLADLEQRGLIIIEEKVRKAGGRSANRYILPPLAVHQIDAASASPSEAANASPSEAAYIEPEEEPEEEPGEVVSHPSLTVEERKRTAVRNVFDEWSRLYSPRAAFDPKRAKQIAARLEERMSAGATVGVAERDLLIAIRNAERDDWLAGRHPNSTGYLKKLSTLLRDAEQVERLIALRAPDTPAEDFDPKAEHEADLRALHGEDFHADDEQDDDDGDDDPPAPVAA